MDSKILEKYIDKRSLRYYCFDWDDNILVMPTMIHLEHRVNGQWDKMDITTSEFTNVRTHLNQYYNKGNKESEWRYYNDTNEESFSEFRDFGPRGKRAFLDDTKKAIQYEKFGPVWDEFINCIIGGNKFLVITARGHEPKTLKQTVKWIVYKVLTQSQRNTMVKNLKSWNKLFNVNDSGWSNNDYINKYINQNYYIGIKSDWFKTRFGSEGKVASPEKYKAIAIKYFVQKIHKFGELLNREIKVGFSDDDLATVESIQQYFKNELSLQFSIDFHSYHTKEDGTKTKLF